MSRSLRGGRWLLGGELLEHEAVVSEVRVAGRRAGEQKFFPGGGPSTEPGERV